MQITVKRTLNTQIPSRSASLARRLNRLGRRLLRLRILRPLKPMAWRVITVAEPPGKLSIRPEPALPPAKPKRPITVVSANLWHDWPRYRGMSRRLESFAELIEAERADIVLLQEVSRTPELHVDRWLAERLGMAFVYSRANGHRRSIGFEEGLAVFSRFPLKDPFVRQLSGESNPFVRRLALGASVETPFGRLMAFSVHLGLVQRGNVRQLARLRSWVSEISGLHTALIGGDFNAHETTPQIHQVKDTWMDTFRHLNPFADGATHELRCPRGRVIRRRRLDYIFLHQGEGRWNVVESRHVQGRESPLSDHRVVLTRLAPAG